MMNHVVCFGSSQLNKSSAKRAFLVSQEQSVEKEKRRRRRRRRRRRERGEEVSINTYRNKT